MISAFRVIHNGYTLLEAASVGVAGVDHCQTKLVDIVVQLDQGAQGAPVGVIRLRRGFEKGNDLKEQPQGKA